MINAINTYAIPVPTYLFGYLHWSDAEMEELQRLTRKCPTRSRYHHPKSAIERNVTPRKEGGRRLLDIANMRDHQIENVRKYMEREIEINPVLEAILKLDKKLTPADRCNKSLRRLFKIVHLVQPV